MQLEITRASESDLKEKPDENSLGFGQYFTDHMLLMSYEEERGWENPKIIKYKDFSLDPAAMVLHYGQAIFEGLKAYRGNDDQIYLFRPKANLERMNISAKRMCMPEIPVDFVFSAMKELIRIEQDWIPASSGATLYIRPTMIATEAGLGVRPALRYLFFIILSPVGAYYPEGFDPVSIFVTDKYVRAVPGGVGNAKTAGNYAASIMAAVEAQKLGYTQVLWLDARQRKYIEEVGTMNIFFLINNELITPPLTGSILPGITRDSVIRLARDWGIKVKEEQISIDDVFTASKNNTLQEVFGTGTAAVISPVGSLYYKGKSCQVNNGKIGKIAQKMFDQIQGIQYGSIKDSNNWIIELSSNLY
jgi:branched-chain amino acid aminotransferase